MIIVNIKLSKSIDRKRDRQLTTYVQRDLIHTIWRYKMLFLTKRINNGYRNQRYMVKKMYFIHYTYMMFILCSSFYCYFKNINRIFYQ